jgi:hypothetical protein
MNMYSENQSLVAQTWDRKLYRSAHARRNPVCIVQSPAGDISKSCCFYLHNHKMFPIIGAWEMV